MARVQDLADGLSISNGGNIDEIHSRIVAYFVGVAGPPVGSSAKLIFQNYIDRLAYTISSEEDAIKF